MDSLTVNQESVVIYQSKAADHLSLAIPWTNLLSYNDFRLLADAITVAEGLLLTFNIPVISREMFFKLFEAKLIRLSFPNDPQVALIWNIEAPYLAIPEDQMEFSVLPSEQFEHCLVSSKYRFFSQTFSTEMGNSSCIATLVFDSLVDAPCVCETSLVSLPTTEKATNLGFASWLIITA